MAAAAASAITTAVSLLASGTGSACLLRSLGIAVSGDHAIGAGTGLVRINWRMGDAGICAELSPPDAVVEGNCLLPLGHQGTGADETRDNCCPILAEDLLESSLTRGFIGARIRLGAVAIPINANNEVLLTRRPRSMRTFPGAWVLPGGSVDATDESVAHAALRELEEETGLTAPLSACEPPLCLWESCFPVSFDGWAAQRRAGGRAAHFLISFVCGAHTIHSGHELRIDNYQ